MKRSEFSDLCRANAKSLEMLAAQSESDGDDELLFSDAAADQTAAGLLQVVSAILLAEKA
jgi:hypothetical protein